MPPISKSAGNFNFHSLHDDQASASQEGRPQTKSQAAAAGPSDIAVARPTSSSSDTQRRPQSTLRRLRARRDQADTGNPRPSRRPRLTSPAISLSTLSKITSDTKSRFDECFAKLCSCDMDKSEHPNTAFLLYELNVEHRFMAAVLDSLTKTLRADDIALTPETVDACLPKAISACADAVGQSPHILNADKLPRGLQALLDDPHAFRANSETTWKILHGIEQRLNMRDNEGWRLIVDRKKITLLSERGIEENWPLIHLFDAEVGFSTDLARGWRDMLSDLDSGQRFSMEMSRRWHATCTGRDGSVPSVFVEDASCPVVEEVSMTKTGRRELQERLRLLRDDYSVPCKVFIDAETKQKTISMGREFIYVNRDDTSMEMLERFARRKAEDYLLVIDRLARRKMDAQSKSDKMLMADIEFIQYCENAHMFEDGNGRVWAILFPNYSALKRGESPILPFEPYVIDGCSAAEVFNAYRDGQKAFQNLVKAPDESS